MTTISVDTSPLQAAREWRGLGLVAAAMSSGLTVVQAEGLESGDPTAFASIDEMIASAVVYGATIGIGRDEAMALLDRTVCGSELRVELPSQDAPSAFSGAVQERSARIADRADGLSTSSFVVEPIETHELDAHPVLAPIVAEALEPSVTPAVERSLEGPTPEQAVAATGELLLDPEFGPEAPWERSSHSSELASWADDHAGSFDHTGSQPVITRDRASIGTRALDTSHAVLERIVGTDRADSAADWMSRTGVRLQERTRDLRERLRRSEHATLIVAIGGGAVLIALLVAIGGALGGGSDEAATGPKTNAATAAAPATATKAAAPAADTKAETKPAALIPPRRITLDVFNNGTRKGYAKVVADKLAAAQYKIGEVGNTTLSYPAVTVIHPKDMAREARIIARRAGITNLQVAPGDTRTITLVVK